MRHALLAACGGFLLGVLWMDVLFDVQVRAYTNAATVPDAVVASIAAYYRRVTTEAAPLHLLIAGVMIATVLGAVGAARPGRGRPLRLLAVAFCVVPIGLAMARVFPNAVALGARGGSLGEQSALARAIWTDHATCFASMAAFTATQVVLARRS